MTPFKLAANPELVIVLFTVMKFNIWSFLWNYASQSYVIVEKH